MHHHIPPGLPNRLALDQTKSGPTCYLSFYLVPPHIREAFNHFLTPLSAALFSCILSISYLPTLSLSAVCCLNTPTWRCQIKRYVLQCIHTCTRPGTNSGRTHQIYPDLHWCQVLNYLCVLCLGEMVAHGAKHWSDEVAGLQLPD